MPNLKYQSGPDEYILPSGFTLEEVISFFPYVEKWQWGGSVVKTGLLVLNLAVQIRDPSITQPGEPLSSLQLLPT